MGNRSKSQRRCGALQVRGRDGVDRRWWSPERDLTVMFPKIVREVFYDLSQPFDEWPAPWKDTVLTLGITSDESGNCARTYAKIVSCVLARGEDLRNALQLAGFHTHRVNALIGMLIMEKLTTRFVETYGATLHQNEFDPNHVELTECLSLLEAFDSEKD